MSFLDETGLAYFLGKLKALFALDSAVEHTTGAETVGGEKKFTSRFVRKGSTVDMADTTSTGEQEEAVFQAQDKNGRPFLQINMERRPSPGYNELRFRLLGGDTMGRWADFRTRLTDDNKFNLRLEKRSEVSIDIPADSNASLLATTAWVRSATGNTSLNAATATKAAQDASGNVITTTYATKTELAAKADDSAVVHKKAFAASPVFTATLAEDVAATHAAPYTITAQQLGGNYQELYIHMVVPAATTASPIRVYVAYDNNVQDIGQVGNAVYTSKRYVGIRIGNDMGMATMQMVAGSGAASASEYVGSEANTVAIVGDATIVAVNMECTVSGAVIPAGTVIKVYAAS